MGRGPVATVLVQKGKLKKGDIFVVGQQWGKVRALFNDKMEKIDFALPSTPVEVLGLNGTPEAGDILNVLQSEAKAREISVYREQNLKNKKNLSATHEQVFSETQIRLPLSRCSSLISVPPLVLPLVRFAHSLHLHIHQR